MEAPRLGCSFAEVEIVEEEDPVSLFESIVVGALGVAACLELVAGRKVCP